MVDKVTKKVESSMYEVLKYLSQFLTIKKISELKKVSRTAIYKVISRLITKGYIRKIGMAYEITEQGLHYLNTSSPNKLRLHNLAFKISILNKPNNWDLKRSKILDLRVLSKEVNLNNNSYEIHSFNNLKIKTTNNSIIFYMPSFYGKSTDECFKQAIDSLFQSIPKIEELFKICLIRNRKANIEIISSHYARLQDSLAKLYKTEGNKLYISDEQGNIWLIADFSFRVDELETIYNKTAKEDMDVVSNFLNDLRKNPATLTNVLEIVREVSANQLIYAKNQETHLALYKGLTKEIKGLSKAIRNIKEKEINIQKNKSQKSIFDYG